MPQVTFHRLAERELSDTAEPWSRHRIPGRGRAMPSVHSNASRQCTDCLRRYPASFPSTVPLRAALFGQARGHQNPGRHESQATTNVLGWTGIVVPGAAQPALEPDGRKERARRLAAMRSADILSGRRRDDGQS